MREQLKGFVKRHPHIFNPIWARLYPILRPNRSQVVSDFEENSAAFSKIYAENLWGDSESASGWGSTLSYTVPIRKHLERLLVDLNTKTFLDAPCGDFHWMAHVRMPPKTNYIGGDIVPELIEKLRRAHGTEGRYRFDVIDIVLGPIPKADLWLCRDVLFHLSNADALSVLRNFANSEIPFLLTTSYDFVKRNAESKPGGFRYINLTKPPFNLPKPRLKIADFVAPAPPRYVGLWSREEVQVALSR
jgi:hypothetical protein